MDNLKLKHHISLKNYNTFGIDVTAKHFIAISTVDELITVLSHYNDSNSIILGGGSNILLTAAVDALVIHINNKGKHVVYEDNTTVTIRVAAGEQWHQVVIWALQHHWGGIENLSLIPGNVGAAPIQNIGAYGVELKDVFVACEALSIATLQLRQFTRKECNFGYRSSIFKTEAKGKYIITSVTLKLTKKEHRLHTAYGSIRDMLGVKAIQQPTIQDISAAVIDIRRSKLPDPEKLGNGGSFFKNPIISATHFKTIQKNYPDIPSYASEAYSKGEVKIPAGWLIERCGFKGKRIGNAGVHKQQALVLVNYGNATGREILALARAIQSKVKDTFDIALEAEVNIV